MKIKKFLEKVADEDREALIDDKDIEFLATIGVDYNKKREEDKKKPEASYYLTAPAFNYKAFLISASCFLVVAIAVFLIVFYSLKPFEPPVGYMDVIEESEPSDLSELNEDLGLFKLTVDENKYNVTVTKTYDTVSGKNLYYSIELILQIGLPQSFSLDIVVNSLYEYKKGNFDDDYIEAQISGYTLKYTEISVPMAPPLSDITCKGKMKIGEQWIYITSYKETALGQSTLVATIESILSFN